MTAVELTGDELVPFLRGAFDVERTAAGIVPLRLPARAFAQMPAAFTREVFRMCAGVRLALITRATALELKLAASRALVEGTGSVSHRYAVDLVVNGQDVGSISIDELGYIVFDALGESVTAGRSVPAEIRFGALGRGVKHVELWLPANAIVELRTLRANAPITAPKGRQARWAHYGSSISHCLGAEQPTLTWPAVAARRVGVDLLNLSAAGNCHLDQFVARSLRDARVEFISIKAGINVARSDSLRYRTFIPAVHGFLDTVRDGHPGTPLLVVSPIVCPALEGLPETSAGHDLTLPRIRTALAEIVDARAADDPNLHFLDGRELFGENDLDAIPDGVHPSPAGYVRIGERFVQATFAGGCFSLRGDRRL